MNSESPEKACDLCGLSARGNISATFNGQSYVFCCMGCRQVFNILLEATDPQDPAKFRETDLFKQCQEKGIIPKSEADLAASANNAHLNTADSLAANKPDANSPTSNASFDALPLNLKISNMWCPACAWLIDQSLTKSGGVIASRCNFSTDRIQVEYNPIRTSPDQIIQSIRKLGYNAALPETSRDAIERRTEFIRFIICAILTMNIMMMSYALYSGFITELTADTIYKLSWPAFVMATIVLFYGGFNFFKKAWAGLGNATFSMETLIIMGSLSAYLYSTFSLLAGSIHVYFDTATMLITLVLLGKTLERRAKRRVLEDLELFFTLKPTKVRICNQQYPLGRYVSAGQLARNDTFLVNETEIVPADGRILSGTGSVDVSSLTGEPLPLTTGPGDFIRSGSKILKGAFKIKADKVGNDSTLGQMIDIIEKALLSKTPLEGKTDIMLQWFVPAIIALATVTAMICRIAGLSTEVAITRAVTVMVISCPCALGIAIPLARVAGISIAGKKGILVRNFKAFEQAHKVEGFVFDKTGTITKGRWDLLEIMTLDDMQADEALALAAGLEHTSDHFIAHEMMRQAKNKQISPAEIHNIQSHAKGLSGDTQGRQLKIGSADFLHAELHHCDPATVAKLSRKLVKHSCVYLGVDGKLAAVFIFGDALRNGVQSTIERLSERGYRLALVSGDGEHTTRAIGKQIGIDASYGEQMPQDKAAFVRKWQSQGMRVAMVGDGINDAPALVQSDLSIAVHAGAQLSREMADITLMRAEPQQILDFLDFTGRVNTKIFQNLGFTFVYNAISIPIAMLGWLTPLIAVSAMLLSSLSVTCNTLLLVKKGH